MQAEVGHGVARKIYAGFPRLRRTASTQPSLQSGRGPMGPSPFPSQPQKLVLVLSLAHVRGTPRICQSTPSLCHILKFHFKECCKIDGFAKKGTAEFLSRCTCARDPTKASQCVFVAATSFWRSQSAQLSLLRADPSESKTVQPGRIRTRYAPSACIPLAAVRRLTTPLAWCFTSPEEKRRIGMLRNAHRLRLNCGSGIR